MAVPATTSVARVTAPLAARPTIAVPTAVGLLSVTAPVPLCVATVLVLSCTHPVGVTRREVLLFSNVLAQVIELYCRRIIVFDEHTVRVPDCA